MFFYSDDPLRDFDRWDAEQQERLKELPICEDCGEPITSESAFYIDASWICEDCIEEYRRDVLID